MAYGMAGQDRRSVGPTGIEGFDASLSSHPHVETGWLHVSLIVRTSWR